MVLSGVNPVSHGIRPKLMQSSSPAIQPGRADACAADRHSLRRAPLPEERALVLIQVPVNLFGPAAQSGL